MFLFFSQREYETALKTDIKLDPRVNPTKIFDELSHLSDQKACIKQLTKKTKNGFKIMRRLSFVHMLLIYSDKFYGIVEKFIDEKLQSSDDWLNDQAIRPYYFFLRKILSSTELYTKTKQPFQKFSFEKSFYIYNMLIEMFKIVAKMPLIGRYYKESNQSVTSCFVQTIAVQAQKLYLPWKTGLQQLFSNIPLHIHHKAQQQLVKALIEDCLPYLNEQMKKLFLDKYFYPYGKGIGIRLFRTEEQTDETTKIIKGIVQDHKQTERRQAHQSLEKTLFPEGKLINYEFLEQTLAPKNSSRMEEMCYQDNEAQEDGEKIIPVQFSQMGIKYKDQKETSDHMEHCEEV